MGLVDPDIGRTKFDRLQLLLQRAVVAALLKCSCTMVRFCQSS